MAATAHSSRGGGRGFVGRRPGRARSSVSGGAASGPRRRLRPRWQGPPSQPSRRCGSPDWRSPLAKVSTSPRPPPPPGWPASRHDCSSPHRPTRQLRGPGCGSGKNRASTPMSTRTVGGVHSTILAQMAQINWTCRQMGTKIPCSDVFAVMTVDLRCSQRNVDDACHSSRPKRR